MIIVSDILNNIQAELPNITETKLIYRGITRVIRDINSRYPGIMTTELALTIEGGFSDGFSNGFSMTTEENYGWDTDTAMLSISPYTREIRDVYHNTQELTREHIDTINNYNTSLSTYAGDKYIYARYDRNRLKFPSVLLTADDTITIKYLKDLIPLTKLDELNSDTELDIPLSFEQVLINGVLFYLYGSNKYKDNDLYKINERAYYAGLNDAKDSEIRNTQLETKVRKYNY